jgi:hypothetical protein
MQILSTRSKESLRRFYESFIYNKRYKSYVRDIIFHSSDEFHDEHQGLFLFTSPSTQEFFVSLRQRKLPVDPCLKDTEARLDTNSDQDHLDLVKSFLDIDSHWVLENDLGM